MPEMAQTVQAMLNGSIDPVVEKAIQLETRLGKKVSWAAGVRASFQHDEEHDQNGHVQVAVGPGLPMVPVSVSGGGGFSTQIHDTNAVQVYFLFSSLVAPTIDPANPLPTVPAPGIPDVPLPPVPDPGQPPG